MVTYFFRDQRISRIFRRLDSHQAHLQVSLSKISTVGSSRIYLSSNAIKNDKKYVWLVDKVDLWITQKPLKKADDAVVKVVSVSTILYECVALIIC
jgi:hypothetical protein